MVRKGKYKIFITILIFVVIFFIFLGIKNYRKEQSTYLHPISIINSKQENVEYSDIEYAIKYNTVFIPMDVVFQSIFGDDYEPETNQTITYNGINIVIDLKNKKITIPNIKNEDNQYVDNSVDVEIENLNHTNYVPVYLISNLPKVIVKIDEKEVYNAKKYINSYDAINDGKEKHKVEIFINQNKDNVDTTYFGEQDGALWREEAYKRIEKYRKSDVNLRIFNNNNDEITNTDLAINMKTNDFKFGTAVDTENVDNVEKKYFNTITSENFNKWWYTSTNGYTQGDNIYNNAIGNGYNYKVHNLWWDYISNSQLRKLVDSEDNNDITFMYLYNRYHSKEITIIEARELINGLIKKFEDIVFAHIKEETNQYKDAYEIDVVNEPITNQYFKYYLYDENLLTDNNFISNRGKNINEYNSNMKYEEFIKNCFKIAKENSNNSKLILNDEMISNQKDSYRLALINFVNNVNKNEKIIKSLGVQYHCYLRWVYSPQSYMNAINDFSDKTGVDDFIISEYDDFNKKTNTSKEINTRSNYVKDALIMAYSNKKVSEFSSWVFYNNERFCNEEREAYKNTVYPWLNYSEKGKTNAENGYNTRLYKGSYTANVTLPNGEIKSIDFNVGSENEINLTYNTSLQNIKLTKLPSKLKYYTGDNIDLSNAIVTYSYDDGTSKNVELSTINDLTISGFDNSKIGKETITLTIDNYSLTFDIEVEENVDEKIQNELKTIKDANNLVLQNNNKINQVQEINEQFDKLNTKIDEITNNMSSTTINEVDSLYGMEFDIIDKIMNKFLNREIDITEDETKNIVDEIIKITDNYDKIYSYFISNDTLDKKEILNIVNDTINYYDEYTNLDEDLAGKYIFEAKNLYANEIETKNSYHNYLKKNEIKNLCNLANNIINTLIEIDENSKPKITINKKNTGFTPIIEGKNITKINVKRNGENIDYKEGDMLSNTGIYRISVDNDSGKNATINYIYYNMFKLNNEDEKYITINQDSSVDKLISIDNSYNIVTNVGEKKENQEIIKTGDKVILNNEVYYLIVKGDINCDGKVNIVDLIKIRKYMVQLENLNDIQKVSAKLSSGDEINVNDLIKLRRYIVQN